MADDARPSPPPSAVTAAELQERFYEPVRWVVDPYIPDGFTLLAAKPKIGKSWLALDIAIAVAQGTLTLGDRKCIQGDVLYAALEDGERRLQDRMRKLIPDKRGWPAALTFWTKMSPLEAGGLDQLDTWANEAPNPRLVILDTYAKVRSPKGRNETLYDADYRQGGAVKTFADRRRIAVLANHHTRKMEADDPLDAVSGTTGLTGVADTILVMRREGGNVILHARGRDVEEAELAMRFDRESCRWSVLGDADEVKMSDERSKVMEALRGAAEPLTAKDVTDETGLTYKQARKQLFNLFRKGTVEKPSRGQFKLPKQP